MKLGGIYGKGCSGIRQKQISRCKSARIRISGNDVIDIRIWTQPPKGADKVPTGKGININDRLFPLA
ncbi:MAG: hypothetical protein ABH844_00075 [Candidatus Omnitrophota bacterium]